MNYARDPSVNSNLFQFIQNKFLGIVLFLMNEIQLYIQPRTVSW
jgi:hypothetical protein